MDTEKTTNKKEKTTGTDFEFNPENIKGMFEMMGKCCASRDRVPDCAAMMKSMMETCCGPKTEDTKLEKQQK